MRKIIFSLAILMVSVSLSGTVAMATDPCDPRNPNRPVYGCTTDNKSLGLTLDSKLVDTEEGLKGIEIAPATTLTGAIVKWTNFFLGFVGVIAIAYIIYGGFMNITAGEDEERAKKGRGMIVNAIIGIIIIISSYAIVNTFIGT